MDGTRDTPLVGRADDLAQLTSAVAAAPAVVTLAGEAGIGKTRLVAELSTHPALAGRRVLVGRCRWIRDPFPLAPFVEALRGLREELAAIPLSPVVGALRPLLPELADVLPPRPDSLDDRATRRHQVFRGLVEVLAAVGPVVVVVEDVHWADEQTVEFLSYLVSAPPAELSLVLTFRGEEVAPRVRAAAARPPAGVGRAEITLAPFDAAATGALAAAVLGIAEVSEEFAAHLCQRASGLPLAVQELVALLRARGTLVRDGDSWARRIIGELDVPAGIRDPVLERVARLDPPARTVLEAAAVLATAPEPLLLAVAGIGEADGKRGLSEALASGLLVEQGEAELGYRHVLAAQAVHESLSGPRRRELHGRAADALQVSDEAMVGRIAHHLRRSGRLAEWAVAAEAAADQAGALGHDAEAARLLADVMRTAPLGTDHRHRVARKLARAVLESPLTIDPDVTALLRAALSDDPPAPTRGELLFTLSLLNTGGDRNYEHQLLLAALPDLVARPDLTAWAMVSLGVPRTPTVPMAERRAWLHRALELVPRLDSVAFQTFVLGKVAMVLAPMGDPHWRVVSERIVALTGGTARHPREVNAYISVAVDAVFAGHHATAERLLAQAHAGAVSCKDPVLKHRVRSGLAILDYCRGEWDGLRDRTAALLDESEFGVERISPVIAGCLALVAGDHDAAGHLIADAVRQIEWQHTHDVLAIPVAAAARLAVARGEPDTFLADLDRYLAVWETAGVWAAAVRSLPPSVQALVAAGRLARAHDLTMLFAERVRDLDAPLARAALPHARGFLAAAQDQWREAATHFLAAADEHSALQCRYEAAQAREEAAACLFAVDDPRAGHHLTETIAAYRKLGARWDLERATGLARRHGMSLPARHRGGPRGYGSELSPREREVAGLAATGRTNREIAAALYLSPKTVDKHLSAALRKLGLRSRTALAHQRHTALGDARIPRNGEFTP